MTKLEIEEQTWTGAAIVSKGNGKIVAEAGGTPLKCHVPETRGRSLEQEGVVNGDSSDSDTLVMHFMDMKIWSCCIFRRDCCWSAFSRANLLGVGYLTPISSLS